MAHRVYFLLYFVWAVMALRVRDNFQYSNLVRTAMASTETVHPAWANVMPPENSSSDTIMPSSYMLLVCASFRAHQDR